MGMNYLGAKYNLKDEYGMDSAPEDSGVQPMQMSEGSAAPAAGITAASAGAGGVNPYLLGGSFLLSYLKAKEVLFNQKKAQDMAIQRQYAGDQEAALNNLNNTWKSALLK